MAVRIGTSEHGGTFYTQGLAFAELFNRASTGEQCVVQTSDASIHNAEQLDRGELEFGFMASNWIGRAKNATAPFTKPIALRMVAPANAGPMCFVKLASSRIASVADFRGKRIAIGAKGSGMEQHIHTIFGRPGHFLRQLHAGAHGLCRGRRSAGCRRDRRAVSSADPE